MYRLLILIFFYLILPAAHAQKKTSKTIIPPKRPLTHDVYDHWKELPFKAITNDGRFAAITINPQEGDGKVVFYDLHTRQQDSVHRADDINLTADSRYAIIRIKAPLDTLKALRRRKKKKEDLPKDTLGIYSFTERKTEKISNVKSYKIPEKAGGWVAYQLESIKEKSKRDSTGKEKTDSLRTTIKKSKPKENSDEHGFTLVVSKLPTTKRETFPYVKEYIFAKYGQGLLFSSTGNDSTLKPGVYWYDLQQEKLQPLYEGRPKQKFNGLAISEEGTQVTFIVDTDTTRALRRYPKLYYWKAGEHEASVLADEKTAGMVSSWIINEHTTPFFSKNGGTLFFATNPMPVLQDTLLLPEEIVNVEVWNWQDSYLYPHQNKRLESDRKSGYLAAVHLRDKKLVPLGSKEIPDIEIGNEGNAPVVLGRSDKPYRKDRYWETVGHEDIFIIDVTTGEKTTVFTKLKGQSILSPQARFVYWFSLPDTAWYSYALTGNKTCKLTQGVLARFADEENDQPDFPKPYGVAGMTINDKQLFVYDRYDLWALDPENKLEPVNVTKIGRQQRLIFRYIRLDPEERAIDPQKPLLLSAFNEVTKASGYYLLSLKDNSLTKLIMSDHRYGSVIKARHADNLIFTRQSFREFPDVWATNLKFTSPQKLTDANPQMKNYRWGTVELVKWTSLDNIPLQGLLYKPENFDPAKKYPMMVNFYEKDSDLIHQHTAPGPIRSSINYAYYVSNGYLVFVPDIVYKIGYPGESAYNCVLPGVMSLIAAGFVDEKHIGVQGHSWGGYQIAYLITRTNLFAAAEAGAPVSNMTSAYGGIRWESGLSRVFQYEKSQSRIGGTLWETPLRYIENSPLFFADKIQTPLLMMHNDADGAVPWYQGIEYFMALKRLNKPVWMLNYNNQGHGLTQRQDKTDFAIRMSQFFHHYLKGDPMPAWMEKGVPAIEKGINKGY